MCITSKEAILRKTKILSFKKENGNIFLSYQNTAQNLSKGRNCMVLPIPGKLKSEWFFDTTKYSSFMKYLADRCIVSESTNYGVRSRSMTLGSKGLEVVNVGMYEIHFSNDMNDIKTLNESLNLEIGSDLLEFFINHYKGFSFIYCIFDGNQKMDSQPIALEYEPINSNVLFFPTMDGHDGEAPKDDRVSVDHIILTELKNQRSGKQDLSFINAPEFLDNREWGGYEISYKMPNGDFYMDLTQNMENPNLTRNYEIQIQYD